MANELVYRIPVSTGKLVGMSAPPLNFNWQRLRDEGITHVVSLCKVDPLLDTTPVRKLYGCVLDDISAEELPRDPEQSLLHIWEAAYHVRAALSIGRGVSVYCDNGLDRTGVILAATLRLRGLPTDRAIALINDSLRAIGAPTWKETSWQVVLLDQLPGEQ